MRAKPLGERSASNATGRGGSGVALCSSGAEMVISGAEMGAPVATPPVLARGDAIGVPRPCSASLAAPDRALLARICAALDIPFASLTSHGSMFRVRRGAREARLEARRAHL